VRAVAESKHEFHSFILARHGKVVAEGWWRPYRPTAPQMLYSLSKSFTSTAVGFAVSEHRLSVDDRVISFFPDELPETVSEHLRELRVRHLLTMSVGHAHDSTGSLWGEEDWVKKFLSLPILHPPGTGFLYNSGATYMLSAIVQRLTSQKVLDYLGPRLFEPLAIEGCTWEMCPRGINTGGWGLKIQTEGLAKFAQLYLQEGAWNGKQLIPSGWVREATSFKIQQPDADLAAAKVRSDWHQGYCYQFWRCRHHAYRGDGAFGQYAIVMPEQEAVLAITSETSDMQGELNLVWEHLLPAMKEGPLSANRGAERELAGELEGLGLAPVSGQASSAVAERISGKRFVVEPDVAGPRSVAFVFEDGKCTFRIQDQNGWHSVTAGMNAWLDGETDLPGEPPKLTRGKLPPVSKVAASAAWKDEHTLQVRLQFYETPHHDSITCRFDGDAVRVEFLDSLAAMSPSRKDRRHPLEGRAI